MPRATLGHTRRMTTPHDPAIASPAPAGAATTTATRHHLHGQYAQAQALDDLRHNLAVVRARIAAACARAGRDAAQVRLLPVSKTVDVPRLRLAVAAGCAMFAENRVQEAQDKAQAMQDVPGLRWAIIGHLQTNKAKYVARFAHEFQALDSLRVAQELHRHLCAQGRTLDVLVQVNTSGEAAKSGLPPAEVPALLRALPALDSLRVRGLMTMAMLSDDAQQVRGCFARLRQLRDRLRQDAPAGVTLQELSMGMSGDYEIAVEEGATIVRVGQALFGARLAAPAA